MGPLSLPTFQPHFAARSAAAQTLWGAWIDGGSPELDRQPRCARLAIPLRDGGALEARLVRGEADLVVVLLHGLGGNTSSSSIRALAERALLHGASVLAIDQRGSGGGLERTDRPYMTGHTDDIADVLGWARSHSPGARIVAVGLSLAGNTLLSYVAVAPSSAPDLAIAVAPPIDLEHASNSLTGPTARLFELAVLARCRRWPPRLRGEADTVAARRIGRFSTLRRFDADYVAPVWGFPSRDAYYASASAVSRTADIVTPTWVLAADDDPLAPIADLTGARWGPGVSLHVTRGGGHLGWIAADSRGRPARWLDCVFDVALRLHAGRGGARSDEVQPCEAK